jgi:hypothetical protein
MKRLDQSEATVKLRLTRIELVAICNALDESLENIEEWEFVARMGVSSAFVDTLAAAAGEILDSTRPPS